MRFAPCTCASRNAPHGSGRRRLWPGAIRARVQSCRYCTLQVFFSTRATRAADHHTALTSLFPSFKARKLVGVLGDTFSFKSFTISSAPPKGGR